MNGEIEDTIPSEEGYDLTEKDQFEEPLTGESTERQEAWRPADEPPGKGIYEGQASGTGTSDEPEGRGI